MKKLGVLIFCVMLSGVFWAPGSFSQASIPEQQIELDGNKAGRTYEGWGTVFSYAKLLYDYPQKERDEILDLLFLPNYGASLQILKMPIGFDGNSDHSCWQANKRSAGDPGNYRRGYGGWLFQEAVKRNPDIKLAALHWGYPAWATDDELKARFIYEYVKGIKEAYGYTIEYIGGNQNESKITPGVTKMLRKKLDAGGFRDVKIVAADEGARVKVYSVIDAMQKDKEYAGVVDIIGVHYKIRPADSGVLDGAYPFGKRIWSTEEGGGNFTSPLFSYATIDQFMKLFLDVKITAAMRWLATASHYENMAWSGNGIIKANEPWSGHYQVGGIVWGIAHITQFLSPGWQMIELDDNHLRLPADRTKVGRIATYKDNKSDHYSMLIRTNDSLPDEGMTLKFTVKNLSQKEVYVWQSDFTEDESEWFVDSETLTPRNGAFELRIRPNRIYSLTTTRGQRKADTRIPVAKPFPFPYKDDFEKYGNEDLPTYFVNISSSFEVASDGKNKVLKQVVGKAPVQWHSGSKPTSQPMTIVGNLDWTDYTVSVKVKMENKGKALLSGRFDGEKTSSKHFDAEGYWLEADDTGRWRLIRKDKKIEDFIVLDSGSTGDVGLNRWFTLSLAFKGTEIKAFINRKQVACVKDSTYKNGNVALAVMSNQVTDFNTPSPTYPIMLFDELEVK